VRVRETLWRAHGEGIGLNGLHEVRARWQRVVVRKAIRHAVRRPARLRRSGRPVRIWHRRWSEAYWPLLAKIASVSVQTVEVASTERTSLHGSSVR
jgi:hypothetical protein